MSYSIDSLSDNCYDGTNILINKLGIKNQKLLDEVEQTITSINSAEIEVNTEFKNVDFEFYKILHYRMFSEIYGWAGEIRNINISKKGTNFCSFEKVAHQGELIFQRLKKENYFKNLNRNSFIEEITDLYCDLNILHPFREGNGRVQRLFLTLLIRNAGYSINFSDIDAELLMIATIKSVSGDIFMLKEIFSENIK